jgi:hypothetical protein
MTEVQSWADGNSELLKKAGAVFSQSQKIWQSDFSCASNVFTYPENLAMWCMFLRDEKNSDAADVARFTLSIIRMKTKFTGKQFSLCCTL